MKSSITWFEKPTKKTLVIFGSLWFVGVSLLILAASDLFRESIFKNGNIILGLLVIMSTISTTKLFLRYYRNKKSNTESIT